MWRGEANEGCLACKERTACFSSLTELLVCILFDVVVLIGFRIDLNSIECVTESKWIVTKIEDLCMLCGFMQALLLQHQCCFHPVHFPGSQHFFSQLDLCMSQLKLLFLRVLCNFAVYLSLVCWSCRTTLVRLVFTRSCRGNEIEKYCPLCWRCC